MSLLLFLQFALSIISLIHRGAQTASIGCAPVKCSSCYFEQVQNAFLYNFTDTIATSPVLSSDYCYIFSSKYNISVGIFDQQGRDMCSAINPAAHLFVTFLTELNARDTCNRMRFYKNINTTFDVSSIGLDKRKYFDLIGLVKFYIQVFYGHTNQEALTALHENIYNITQYPADGFQNITVITKQITQAHLMESIPFIVIKKIIYDILNQPINLNINGSVLADDIFLLFLLAIALESSSSDAAFIQFLDQEISTLSNITNTLKQQHDDFKLQNGECTWEFKKDFINGLSYEIWFNQTKGNN